MTIKRNENPAALCFSCRFVLGGEHGKLKHGPPQGHSAVVESLMPRDRLKLEPCYVFGEVSKNILSGPTEITDYVPFVPKAINTASVRLQDYNLSLFHIWFSF